MQRTMHIQTYIMIILCGIRCNHTLPLHIYSCHHVLEQGRPTEDRIRQSTLNSMKISIVNQAKWRIDHQRVAPLSYNVCETSDGKMDTYV